MVCFGWVCWSDGDLCCWRMMRVGKGMEQNAQCGREVLSKQWMIFKLR